MVGNSQINLSMTLRICGTYMPPQVLAKGPQAGHRCVACEVMELPAPTADVHRRLSNRPNTCRPNRLLLLAAYLRYLQNYGYNGNLGPDY